ncbi:hypothetical protein ASPZODRAFT_159753 [Penicilliopsis zonata CBS 506.65]|uniref:pH-response regulator protein palC n=1 Tax=Penicilliopsis zonata CBS 506.65 TaxID=1073090 RepID=A0A1L9SGB1_9EURO|nr:hypothetical protein ASPZODRAFT_159753 [Penicilliopsis zonata CBS 506.65]OJJ46196.1 hypothetical protein ASPZODRAFT_159753 [Penicilliopsis zonata CBS 506.65]
MVYAFALPTTSHLSFQASLSSSTHPSLPQAASTARHALRLALKAHRRLPRGPRQDAHLPAVLAALTEYLPYLFAISHGLSGRAVELSAAAEVDIALHAEIEAEWLPTLSETGLSLKALAHSKGGRSGRIHGRGIDFEIVFVLATLGYVLAGLARSGVVTTLYAAVTPSAEQRTAAVQTATRQLLQAASVHYLLSTFTDVGSSTTITTSTSTSSSGVPDVNPGTHSALSSLALAEATLLAVLKDDSYVAASIQARNPHDREWMVRAPTIPKVRALLFARLCVRAAEYAEQAAAGLGAVGGGDADLVRYVRVLGRVARARACRFFGIDAELAGKVGEAIAWLRAARGALGLPAGEADATTATTTTNSKSKGFSKWKKEWAERREERRMDRDAGDKSKGELEPGDNAGRDEEVRVIEMLETKWVKMNDTINTQIIPPSGPLLANLPSGRDIHSPPGPYKPPLLDEDQLVRMRAPPEEDNIRPESEDSEEEAVGEHSTYY